MAQQLVQEINRQEIINIEIVGGGAFGQVYKATRRGCTVAAKYFNQANDATFANEVRQLASVPHPNVVALYGKCTLQLPICIVMEFADGGSLHNLLHKQPRITITRAQAMSWIKQFAQGLAYLHSLVPRPMIHRDLKPANLLLFKDTTVLKIGDFGFVTILRTQMTSGKGTPNWMAPEVFDSTTYTEKCDIYSFGIIMCEIFSREIPFREHRVIFDIMESVRDGNRPPIKNCPEQLVSLITNCWHQDPAQRPAMSEVVMELERIH